MDKHLGEYAELDRQEICFSGPDELIELKLVTMARVSLIAVRFHYRSIFDRRHW
jgi:hypothetical protein